MDIDEFLDRELSDLDLPTGKAQGQDIRPITFQFNESSDTSSLFDHIKSSLSAKNLDEAERSYLQLWHILVQQKLKWDKSLYEQLSVLNRQFQSALVQSSEETKKKAQQVYELISRAKASIKEGRKEEPYKIYAQVQEISNSIPNVFFEEKRMIQEQVMEYYRELKNTTDNELLKRVFALLQEIYGLIEKINAAMKSNDIINAIVHYNKCIELFNQVPEGFLRHKNSAGMRLLDIYKSLSIYSEISNLHKQLINSSYQRQQPQAPQGQKQQDNQYAKQQQKPIQGLNK